MNLSTAAIIASLLPAPAFVLNSQTRFIEALSPPVIPHVYLERGRLQVLHFDGKRVRSDRKWPGPIIIKVSPSKYVIWWKGQIRVKEVEGDNWLLEKLLKIGGPPSPPTGGNGNGDDGNMDHGPNPPFRLGEIVRSKVYPEYGLGEVVFIHKIKDFDGVEYWSVTVDFIIEGEIERIMANANTFMKAKP